MATINTNEILYEINTPLRFYDNILKKNRFRYPNKNADPYKLLTPQHCFLPFMLSTPAAYQQGIEKFEVIADDNTVTSININLLSWSSFLGRDYYEYRGQDHGQFFTCGFYYLVITHNDGSRYFSEDFYVTPSGYCGDVAVNGKFTDNLNGWTVQAGSITWSNGRAHFAVGGGTKQLYQAPPVSGRIRITFTIEGWTGSGNANFQVGGIIIGKITGNGVYSYAINPAGGNLYFNAESNRGFDLDDVTIATISSNSMDCNIMMEWGTDGCDFGNQFYGAGFFNRFIFPDDVDMFDSKWKIVRQATKNGNDSDIDQFIKRQEIHHIELIAPHYVAQALVEMSIHPVKTFVSKRCFGRALMYDVTVTPKPVLNSSMYQIDIDFSLSEVVETGCCGELERCLEPCQVAYPYTEDACVEGRVYIGANKTYATCIGGVLVNTPCETGLMTHAEYDNSVTTPAWWLWNDETGEWDEAPAIWDIENISGNLYKIYALLIPNTQGQLQVSYNGGTTWVNIGNVHSSTEWINGVEFTLLEGTEYLLRIYNRAGVCDYGATVPLSYTTLDTDLLSQYWIAEGYHKIWRGMSFDDISDPPTITIQASITSVLCNAVEQLGSPVNFTVDNTNALFALGSDGQLYLTNIVDQINANLPAGYECFDDMRVIKYPVGESFHFTIECIIEGAGYTEDWIYEYDDTASQLTITP